MHKKRGVPGEESKFRAGTTDGLSTAHDQMVVPTPHKRKQARLVQGAARPPQCSSGCQRPLNGAVVSNEAVLHKQNVAVF